MTLALVTGNAARLALADGTVHCGLASLYGLWYNSPCHTNGSGALFCASADAFRTEYQLWVKRSLSVDLRPAVCVTASATDRERFAMNQEDIERYRNKEWLKTKYCDEKLSCIRIANLVGCAPGTVRRWLVRFGIPRRSGSEAALLKYERDDSSRRFMSNLMKSRWANGDSRQVLLDAQAKFNTEEYRKGMSERTKELWRNEDYRERQVRAAQERWQNPEYRRKQVEDAKNRWKNDEYRQAQVEKTKEQWKDPDFRAMHVRISKKTALRLWQDDEYRQNQSETFSAYLKQMWQDDEYRSRKSEQTKRLWEQGVYDGVFNSPTSIEIEVAKALDNLEIEHISQFRPPDYSKVYDEYIPPKTLIEVHGDYWHGPKNPENQRRDAQKAQWARSNGYDLFVIWEHDIREQGALDILCGLAEQIEAL